CAVKPAFPPRCVEERRRKAPFFFCVAPPPPVAAGFPHPARMTSLPFTGGGWEGDTPCSTPIHVARRPAPGRGRRRMGAAHRASGRAARPPRGRIHPPPACAAGAGRNRIPSPSATRARLVYCYGPFHSRRPAMTLATAYWCVLIAALLPYVWVVFAKAGAPG